MRIEDQIDAALIPRQEAKRMIAFLQGFGLSRANRVGRSDRAVVEIMRQIDVLRSALGWDVMSDPLEFEFPAEPN